MGLVIEPIIEKNPMNFFTHNLMGERNNLEVSAFDVKFSIFFVILKKYNKPF